MTTHAAGELRQAATTAQMPFEPDEVGAFLAERYTVRPGDGITVGSPAKPGQIAPGVGVEIWYESIGTLRNAVVEACDRP